MSGALVKFCVNPQNPLVIVRGLDVVLDLDLSLFSSKTLKASNPEFAVEVREQVCTRVSFPVLRLS